jgi:ABC-2 type transport system permease protein
MMPATVEEVLEVGVYAPNLPQVIADQMEESGMVIITAESQEDLRAAILAGDYNVGAVFPANLAEQLIGGQQAEMTVLFASDFPDEVKDYYALFFREIGYILKGQPINIQVDEVILGRDMVGQQIPQRDRMLPLFAVLILMTETMGLATLISAELETGTLQALLITPMNVRELFAGKLLTGVGLAFTQALFVVAVTGGLNQQPVIVMLTLLLGGVLVTGLGFLMAAVSKDMMSVIGWSIPGIIILSIPSFGVMFPGSISDWVRVIPSHYLVDTVHQVANLDASWGDVWQNFLFLLGFDLVFLWLGVYFLQRKMR